MKTVVQLLILYYLDASQMQITLTEGWLIIRQTYPSQRNAGGTYDGASADTGGYYQDRRWANKYWW